MSQILNTRKKFYFASTVLFQFSSYLVLYYLFKLN